MSYASVTEIVEEFKSLEIDTSDSMLTTAKIQRWLDESDAIIDSYLSRYVLPITATDALTFLKKIEIDLTTYRIVKIIKVKVAATAKSTSNNQELLEGFFYKQAIKKLEMIQSGESVLPGEQQVGTNIIRSYNADQKTEPRFKKDEQQW